jgi:hypothetical protein
MAPRYTKTIICFAKLAGFAKAADLSYFLKTIAGIRYMHQPLLAPTESMLRAYKKEKGDWNVYQGRFMSLMRGRQIENRCGGQRASRRIGAAHPLANGTRG